MLVSCNICDTIFEKEAKEVKRTKSNYCSKVCFNKSVSMQSKKLNSEKYLIYIIRWKDGLETGMKGTTSISRYVRRYIFEKFNSKCTKCGWNEINVDGMK